MCGWLKHMNGRIEFMYGEILSTILQIWFLKTILIEVKIIK